MDEQKKTSGSLALNGAPQVITIPPSDPVRDRKLRVAAYTRRVSCRKSADEAKKGKNHAAFFAYVPV